MERRKPGPVGKGVRRQLKVRLPPPLVDAVQAEAARRGLTVNDLLGQLLAGETGVPYEQQEALKISA